MIVDAGGNAIETAPEMISPKFSNGVRIVCMAWKRGRFFIRKSAKCSFSESRWLERSDGVLTLGKSGDVSGVPVSWA